VIVEVHTGFWWENLKERGQLEDLGVDGKIILKWIFGKWNGVIDWIHMTRDKDKSRALVNAIMNLRVP
jgi:hypothetical protein